MEIQQQQMSAFESAAMLDYERRALKHLRGPLAKQTAEFTDAELLARIRATIPHAAQYGLESEQETIVFLDTSFLLGDEKFDRNPAYEWTADLLNDAKFTAREKAALLIDRAYSAYKARTPKAE
jgi:hypothetical protein